MHRVHKRQEAYFISLMYRLPREIERSPYLEIFKSLLDMVLGNLL